MFVITVSVRVKDENIEEFKKSILANAHGARAEAGNLRFDVLQSQADPAEFMLYEVYRSEDAFKEHQKTEHYLTWRAKAENWMAQPRKGTRFTPLFPLNESQWKS